MLTSSLVDLHHHILLLKSIPNSTMFHTHVKFATFEACRQARASSMDHKVALHRNAPFSPCSVGSAGHVGCTIETPNSSGLDAVGCYGPLSFSTGLQALVWP